MRIFFAKTNLNPLNTKLNPICHLLALLGAHPILHISRIRVNVLYVVRIFFVKTNLNPLNTELDPICHLLALLGAHHILHVSRIRINVIWFYLIVANCLIYSCLNNWNVVHLKTAYVNLKLENMRKRFGSTRLKRVQKKIAKSDNQLRRVCSSTHPSARNN